MRKFNRLQLRRLKKETLEKRKLENRKLKDRYDKLLKKFRATRCRTDDINPLTKF